jgi:hypothetical protein
MLNFKRGAWLNFELRDPKAGVVRLATSCISTSAESAGHYTTVRSTGKIVEITDRVTTSPQTSQGGPAQGKASAQ